MPSVAVVAIVPFNVLILHLRRIVAESSLSRALTRSCRSVEDVGVLFCREACFGGNPQLSHVVTY